MKVVKERFTEALRDMKVGDKVSFPLDNADSVMSIAYRLSITMWRVKPKFRRASYDQQNGTITVERYE